MRTIEKLEIIIIKINMRNPTISGGYLGGRVGGGFPGGMWDKDLNGAKDYCERCLQ